jgi:hypothetical protein
MIMRVSETNVLNKELAVYLIVMIVSEVSIVYIHRIGVG